MINWLIHTDAKIILIPIVAKIRPSFFKKNVKFFYTMGKIAQKRPCNTPKRHFSVNSNANFQ